MAEARPRVVVVAPGGAGLTSGLDHCARDGTVVTAYDDARLRVAALAVEDPESIELVPFGDLVGRVVRMQGGTVERLVTRGQRDAMTILACESLSGESNLVRSLQMTGTARLASQRLEELRHLGIDGPDLRLGASRLNGSLADKLETLAELSDLVKDSMDVAHREYVTDRVKSCLDSVLDSVGPLNHVVVIAGPDERPLYDAWLLWLCRQGVEVDYVIELLPGRPDVFLPAQRSIARLGSKKRTVVGEEGWYEVLFTDRVAATTPSVEIVEASDVLAECEWALRGCGKLLDEGTPHHRIGIFAREASVYGPLLTATAERFGVTLQAVKSAPLLSCGLATVVLQALRAAASGDLREMARLAKTSYCQTSIEAQGLLWEAVSELTSEHDNAWSAFQGWLKDSAIDAAWLGRFLEWRQSHSEGTATLSTWLERFRQLVGETAIADEAAASNPQIRSRDMRAQTVMQRSIADYAFVYDQAGLRELSLSGFVALVERIWKDETVTVETPSGGVFFGSDPTCLPELDNLFVLGMLEGSMPKRRREDPLLDDEARNELTNALGVRVPDSRDESRTERDQFIRLSAAPTKSLILSYPLTDDDRDNVPAFYLTEIERAAGTVTKSVYPRQQWVPLGNAWSFEADRRFRDALEGPRRYAGPSAVTLIENKAVLRPNWEAGVKPGELGLALNCPFQAAYRYRLRVSSPSSQIGPWILLDLPRLAGLSVAKDPQSARKALLDELDRLLARTAQRIERWEASLLETTGRRWIDEWVEREFHSRTVWPRDDGSSFSNVGLDSHGLRNNPKIEGKTIHLVDELAGLTTVNGVSVIQLYQNSAPKTTDVETQVFADRESFKYGLYLMAQFNRNSAAMALEVDSTTGSRTLLVLSEDRGRLRSDQGRNLSVRGIGVSPTRAFRCVRERLKTAVNLLEKADASPKPGEHCSTCWYGELCRRSAEHGDVESPFGEDET